MPKNVTNASVFSSMIARNLDTPSPIKVIADVSGMYNDPLYYLISYLNKGQSKSWNYPKYETSQFGNLSIVSTITSVVQSGLNLVVNYTPSRAGVDPYRTNWIVLDKNLVQGRIIAHQLGQVTIEPDGVVLSSATQFQVGTRLKNGWNASTNRQSRRTEDLTYDPDVQFNLAAVSRNTKYIDLEDQIETRPQMYGKSLYYSQERIGIQQWVKEMSIRYLVDKRGEVNGYDGKRNKNGGILWGIENRNGFVDPATAPFVLSDLRDYIEVIRKKDATPNLNLALFAGTNVLSVLQQSIGDDIKFAGTANTFGVGDKGGINVTMYKYLDCTISFMPMAEFDNPQGIFSDPASYNPGTTEGNNSMLLMNTNALPAKDGGSVPVCEMFHRGSRPIYYKHIPGMIEPGREVQIEDFEVSSDPGNTSSDEPGTTALMYTFSGIDVRDAKGMVYRRG